MDQILTQHKYYNNVLCDGDIVVRAQTRKSYKIQRSNTDKRGEHSADCFIQVYII